MSKHNIEGPVLSHWNPYSWLTWFHNCPQAFKLPGWSSLPHPQLASGSQPSPSYPSLSRCFLNFVLSSVISQEPGTRSCLKPILLANTHCPVNKPQRLSATGTSRTINNTHFPHNGNWDSMYPRPSLMWNPVSSVAPGFQAQQPGLLLFGGSKFILARAICSVNCTFVYVCVHVGGNVGVACVCVSMHGGQTSISGDVINHVPLSFIATFQLIWPASEPRGPECLHHYASIRVMGASSTMPSFYLGARDQNTGLPVYTANILPTEPSPWSW